MTRLIHCKNCNSVGFARSCAFTVIFVQKSPYVHVHDAGKSRTCIACGILITIASDTAAGDSNFFSFPADYRNKICFLIFKP